MFTADMGERATWRDEWTDMTPVERSFLITFFVCEYAYLVLLFGGVSATVFGWHRGAHIALVGLTVYWFGHLGFGVAVRVYGALEMVPVALIILGINMAVFASRLGVLLMLVGLTSRLLGHLIVGAIAYRKVMGRPWPSVRPLDDDEDW